MPSIKHAFIVLAITGCASQTDTIAQSASSDDAWLERALPALQAADCVSCHSTPSPSFPEGPGFLAGAAPLDIRDSLVASGLGTRVVTKGAHLGEALTTEQARAVLDWLDAVDH